MWAFQERTECMETWNLAASVSSTVFPSKTTMFPKRPSCSKGFQCKRRHISRFSPSKGFTKYWWSPSFPQWILFHHIHQCSEFPLQLLQPQFKIRPPYVIKPFLLAIDSTGDLFANLHRHQSLSLSFPTS